ncbi:uncharacterized protein DUF4153 [Hephaestia caeni]|uniref:Uncharacterized protein DUF4153 n=1 Tax=Hephaestia caeni TaxID=645617 RepID=A0A397NN36_9SPHN|nr:DUF4153 domain-containing protein [Hephaestia caeni]RIA36657.1 uncharacterized protein DUF4153 [Hephaestia caeni]
MDDAHAQDEDRWPVRPILLAVVGALACLAVQQIGDGGSLGAAQRALMAAIATGALAFGFTAERVRLAWSVIFAAVVAVVTGLVFWWSGAPDGGVWWVSGWSDASLFLAIAIAAPLFQTARDQGRAAFPYDEVHAHVWTNIVLWCASWAFVGVTLALAFLLSALFELIGIGVLRDLLEKEWFVALLIGGAFGGALGLFREREAVVRTLRRVVTAVLSVLAPVLGTGLGLFLLALPFTGLSALWEATKSTTPILLACAFGAWVLANTVIGDGVEDEATNPALRWGAAALGAVILPLAVIAGVATGLRIDQYGFTPERLWAVVFVAIAILVGLAYWVALVRRRLRWAEGARPANLRIAFAVAGVALFLATPILSFNALSAHDQVARLEAGKVTPDKFDWAALAFDFGEPGKRAVARLVQSKNGEVVRLAKKAAAAKDRWSLADRQQAVERASNLQKRLRILPRPIALPRELQEGLADWNACGWDDRPCIVVWQSGSAEAISISGTCKIGDHAGQNGKEVATRSDCAVAHLVKRDDRWKVESAGGLSYLSDNDRAKIADALASGEVSIRPVERRQVFIGGVPVGDAFE